MVTRFVCGVVSLVVAVGMGPTAGAQDLGDGLVLCYDFDDYRDLGEDLSGNGYDGTLMGYPLSQVTGARGWSEKAAEFVDESVADYSYIDVPQVPSEEVPSSALTVAFWANLDRFFEADGFTGERNTVFSTMAAPNGAHPTDGTGGITVDLRGVNWEDGATSAGFRVCLQGADVPGERNEHTIVDYIYGENDGQFIPEQNATGKWFHMAVTYDKATASSVLYLNGNRVADLPVTEAVDVDTDWCQAYVGKSAEGDREFRGRMDELLVYSRALTEEEIGWITYIEGDLNSDGAVNSGDLDIVRANWRVPGPIGDCDAVPEDPNDLDIVRANWGFALADLTPVPRPAAVPEPGVVVLVSFGIGMVLVLRQQNVR